MGSEYKSPTQISNTMEFADFQCPDGRRRRSLRTESAKSCNTHVDHSITGHIVTQ